MKKNLKFIVLALVIIGVVGLWQASVLRLKNQDRQAEQLIQESQNIDITFTFASDQQETIKYNLVPNSQENLLAITQATAKQANWAFESEDYGSLGVLVTKIKEQKNGQDNKYWQYYVNGQMPQVGADKYMPQVGEKIEWIFAESTF